MLLSCGLLIRRDLNKGTRSMFLLLLAISVIFVNNLTSAAQVGCMNLRFSNTLGTTMVLQREPEASAVYGTFETTLPESELSRVSVTVTISNYTGDLYSVMAEKSFLTSFSNENPDLEGNVISDYKFKALLRPMPTGGSYKITAKCSTYMGSTLGSDTLGARASVVAAGEVATLKYVSFGDVWYCGGQSNMAHWMRYTMMRNESISDIEDGKYRNIRYYGAGTTRGTFQQPWRSASVALRRGYFERFSSTCWYFAQALTDELIAMNQEVPPIGLVHTAIGGSTIEDWLDDDTLDLCTDACKQDQRGLFYEFVEPYLDMTIKGWVWYQGENNMAARNCKHGNYLRRSGYACYIAELVKSWRALWSATPGTTNPLAPFGSVGLPESGSLGGTDIGTMRLAQTAGFGVLPNPAMPNTFLVQSYDQDDPYLSLDGVCDNTLCRELFNEGTCGEECDARCGGFCLNASATPIYMGLFHPRPKKEIGNRLGRAAAILASGKNERPTTGPTLAGCSRSDRGDKLTISFNRTLMVDDTVTVKNYVNGRSKMEVLVNSSLFCMHTINRVCVDDGYGNSYEKRGDPHEGWVAVDFSEHPTESSQIVLDLSSTGGVAYAVRYVWHGTCCNNEPLRDDLSTDYCPLSSCPIVGGVSNLPANPFIAKVVDGKCKCIPPQVCDGTPV